MATKTILEKEQLELLLSTYKEVGTFAAAGRAVGISSAVAKRIIGEHLKDESNSTPSVPITYNGPAPLENPTRENIWYALYKDNEWWEDYGK